MMRIAILSGGTGWHVQDVLRAAGDLGHVAEIVNFRTLAAGVEAEPAPLDRRAISPLMALSISARMGGATLSLTASLAAESRSVLSHAASLWPGVPHIFTFERLSCPSTAAETIVSKLCALQSWRSWRCSRDGSAVAGAMDAWAAPNRNNNMDMTRPYSPSANPNARFATRA